MSQMLIDTVERKYMKAQPPAFHVGDTVDVRTRIREGARERVQTFNGVVIARGGRGINATFTVRRIVNNEGVERVFLVHSPLVVEVQVKRRGRVRRAKLYYLRHRVGKARRLRELRISKAKSAGATAAAKPESAAAPAEAAGAAPEPVAAAGGEA